MNGDGDGDGDDEGERGDRANVWSVMTKVMRNPCLDKRRANCVNGVIWPWIGKERTRACMDCARGDLVGVVDDEVLLEDCDIPTDSSLQTPTPTTGGVG